MTTTNLFLLGLMVVGIIIFRQLRELSEKLEKLKSHLDQAAVDDALSQTCPKLFFDPRQRSGLRCWYRDLYSRSAQDAAYPKVFWHDRYQVFYKLYASDIPSQDVSRESPERAVAGSLARQQPDDYNEDLREIEQLASQNNRWAQVQLVATASHAFQAERRKELGLTRMEAEYLLYTLWSEEFGPFLPLRENEWKIESILAYLLQRKGWYLYHDAFTACERELPTVG